MASKLKKVTLAYKGKIYNTGHGKVFFDNSVETVKHLYSRDYIPKSAATGCGADYSPGARAKQSIKQDIDSEK